MNVYAILPGLLGRENPSLFEIVCVLWMMMEQENWKFGTKEGRNKSHKKKGKNVGKYLFYCLFTHTMIKLRGKNWENWNCYYSTILSTFFHQFSTYFFYLLFELLKIYFLLLDIIVCFFLFYADSQMTS